MALVLTPRASKLVAPAEAAAAPRPLPFAPTSSIDFKKDLPGLHPRKDAITWDAHPRTLISALLAFYQIYV